MTKIKAYQDKDMNGVALASADGTLRVNILFNMNNSVSAIHVFGDSKQILYYGENNYTSIGDGSSHKQEARNMLLDLLVKQEITIMQI